MEIVRVKLTADDVDPPGTRYNPDCDCIQTTVDGGATWTDNPAADPRHNDAYRLPARTGSDPRCDAAEAMTQHFKAQVDTFLSAGDQLAFVNAIIQIAGLFFGLIGLFASKIFLLFEALLTIGVIAVDAAMTEEVYDQIKCIIYCHIGDDGQMTAAQLAAIQSDIDSQIGGTPNIVFDLFAGLWGEVEWSNAGAVGEFTGDCDECDCTWQFELRADDPLSPTLVDFTNIWVYGGDCGWYENGVINGEIGDVGEHGVCWKMQGGDTGGSVRIVFHLEVPSDTTITYAAVFAVTDIGSIDVTGGIDETTVKACTAIPVIFADTGSEITEGSYELYAAMINAIPFSTQAGFNFWRIRGTGTNPFTP